MTLKEYADALIKNREELIALAECEGVIYTYSDKKIHIYSGIEKLADALSCELTRKDYNKEDPEFLYHWSFKYKGFVFFSIGSELRGAEEERND